MNSALTKVNTKSATTMNTWIEDARQDLAYAWRGLVRSRGFTVAVVVVLSLGMGANAALFALIDRVFLATPAGVDAPHQIRRLYYIEPQSAFRAIGPTNGVNEPVDYPEYLAIRASATDNVQFAVYNRPDSVESRVDNAPVSAMVSYVARSYFTTLRVRPAKGRLFTPDEDRIDVVGTAAIISDAFWHRAFAGDVAVLGKQVHIGDRTYSIVGIAPRGFDGIDLDRVDMWLPLGALPPPPFFGRPWYHGGFHVLRVIARVPPGVAEQRVTSAATAAYRHEQERNGVRDSTSTIITGPIIAALGPADREQEVSISLRLAGVSLILLIIAVANVANLLLVRGMRRRREIAIRRALGISTVRLCRQLVSESLLLSTLAAAAAVVIAVLGSAVLRTLLLPEIHWSGDSRSAQVVAFIAIVSIVVGMIAGTAPALYAGGLDVSDALKGGVKSARHRRVPLRSALMIGQVALSVLLLGSAGLFVRSLRNVRDIDLGFDSDGLVAIHANYLDLVRSREVATAFEAIATEMSRVPGVRQTALASHAPMQGSQSTRIFLPGRDSMPTVDGIPPLGVFVSPEYFSTVNIRLVAGRTFAATDREGTAPVAVVSRTMAEIMWPGENPIGKCILAFTRTAPCTSVVGVIENVHTDAIIEPRPFMKLYLLFAQNPKLDSLRFGARGIGRVLLVRTQPGAEATVMHAALRIAREHLPGAASLRANDVAEVLEPKFRPWRLGATLFSVLGILAAIVAVVGVYSVIAYATSQRAHEMSIRMALGARGQDIVTLVAVEGLRVLAISIAVGIAAAVAMARFVGSLLYGVSAHDPLSLVGACALLGLMGFVAILTPALRAASGDPVFALRAD